MADCYERAAAIAVFQGNIRRGIASLKDGASVAKQRGDTTKSKHSLSCDHHVTYMDLLALYCETRKAPN